MALINKLNKLGDSIRAKTGLTELLTIDEMAEAVDGIESVALPAEAYVISGNCNYRFSNNGWGWFVNTFGDRVTTENISNAAQMFYMNSKEDFTTIPFDLNMTKSCTNINNMFDGCSYLTSLPAIIPEGGAYPPPTGTYNGMLNLTNFLNGCLRLRTIPYDYFNNFISQEHYEASMSYVGGSRNGIFQNCYSLRQLPDISRLPSGQTSIYTAFYYNALYGCASLDEAIDFPVITAKYTSNAFSNTFKDCLRLKNIIFKTNEDGSPIAATWKSQTIDLSGTTTEGVGYAKSTQGFVDIDGEPTITTLVLNIHQYNSGIGYDKLVVDDATYQALKDDADWCTNNLNYSRYNHDSAVATINSLPDVSAGSGNVIKFRGAAGALTDGGAINTLTDSEIAVAAAKGWTVSFV